MRLSASNIGWRAEQDEAMYARLRQLGFAGLEIAPTRLFPENPYDRASEAAAYFARLYERYGLRVSSMQSIWYGRTERLFGPESERAALLDYTRRAIDWAAAIGCPNMVFGCPRNRALPEGANPAIGAEFFRALGEYAAARGVVVAMEPNPPVYHTNYINTTEQAAALIRQVDSAGFMLNLDIGTCVGEDTPTALLRENAALIHHVHLSELGLPPVPERPFHGKLAALLREVGYDGYVSLEMGAGASVEPLDKCLQYLRSVFSASKAQED